MQISKRTDIQKFDGTQEVRLNIYRLAAAMNGKPFDRLEYHDDLEYYGDKDNPDVTSLRGGLVPVINGKPVPLLAVGTYPLANGFYKNFTAVDTSEQITAKDDLHKEAFDTIMERLGDEDFNMKALCDAMVEKFKDGGVFACEFYNYQYYDKEGNPHADGNGTFIGFNHK
jgi:hypothetical protein